MVPAMETPLLTIQADVADMQQLGITSLTFAVIGTEQGLQGRVTLMTGDHVLQDGTVHMSISYTDLQRLSYDMEKGKLSPPYSIAGTGLEVDHWLWKRSE
jgi:hypothetical protein